MPAAGQHAAWPGVIAALFEQLPMHGWHTLAPALPPPATLSISAADISVASPAEPDPAAREVGAEPATTGKPPVAPDPADETGDTSAAPSDQPATTAEEVAQRRLRVALDHLNRNAQGRTVAIGLGYGAVRAARLVAADPAAFAGLVLIDTETASATHPEILELLTALPLPVLDLLTAPAPADRSAAADRARQLMAKQRFVQITLPAPGAPGVEGRHESVARRVRGWLDREIAPR